MPSVRPGLGFARFVYRPCYGYQSYVIQRFIRFLINRSLINTSFTFGVKALLCDRIIT